MTQFRYNVLLRIEQSGDVGLRHETQPTPKSAIKGNTRKQLNWKHQPVTVQEIHQQLLATEPEIVIITNVPNSRVNAAVATANWLQNKQAPKTVGRMRELLQGELREAQKRQKALKLLDECESYCKTLKT